MRSSGSRALQQNQWWKVTVLDQATISRVFPCVDGRTSSHRAAAPAIARPVAHDSHAHLVFPNLLDTFRSLLSIIVIALFVLTFVVQPFRIPSESMERTLLVGDFLLVNKVVYGKPGAWRWLLPYEQVQPR